jgi:hypothetical protein
VLIIHIFYIIFSVTLTTNTATPATLGFYHHDLARLTQTVDCDNSGVFIAATKDTAKYSKGEGLPRALFFLPPTMGTGGYYGDAPETDPMTVHPPSPPEVR